jgi:hypothetical protein
MTRARFSGIAAAVLLVALPTAASAQDPHPAPPPLKPGQSAGIHAAQHARTGLALIGTGAIIAVVIVAATASSGGAAGNNPVNQQFNSASTTAP